MATITAIRVQKRNPDRVNIDLDGEFAFAITGMLGGALRVGQVLDEVGIADLQTKDAEETAYQHALRLLSRREHSESELRTNLRRRKTAEEIVDRTIVRLREHGHADDPKFARAWVENRNTFRPRGRRALAWELQRKGIAPEIAEAALSDIDEAALAHEAGHKKARQLNAADWPDFRTKVSAYLARRGFPTSIVTTTVADLFRETHGTQPSILEEETP